MTSCVSDKKRTLMIFTSICAGMSTVLLVLSIASENWLNTKELYRGDIAELNFLPQNFTGPVYVATNFGLWRSCQKYTDKDDVVYKDNKCQNIPYKEESEDNREEDTILSLIIKNCKKTAIFPLVSVVLEITGDVLCFLGYCFGRRRLLVFLTGVTFVLSGMSLLIGSILFMGAVTGETSHQPAVSNDETPAFRYAYGASFVMMATSFCLDEVSGVLSVYLFIIRHKESVKKKHAKLTAFKSKADQIQNYFKRKSRHHTQSLSSNGEMGASRRSSYMPLSAEAATYHEMERDSSHLTIMTTVESHQPARRPSAQSRVRPEIKINDHMIDDPDAIFLDSIPPPGEFRTDHVTENGGVHDGDDSRVSVTVGRCKTTQV